MHTNHLIKTKVVLPSGNWFSGFICNTKNKTVYFNYHDRRRYGQIARWYTVIFNDKLEITDIIAVSVQGSRVEHFGACRAEKLCRELLRRALDSQKQKEEEKEEELSYFEESPTKWYFSPIFFVLMFLACVGLFIIAIYNKGL